MKSLWGILLLAALGAGLFFGTAPAQAGDDFTVEPGYTSLFNGKDLTGWRLGKIVLDGKTESANKKWHVENGAIVIDGGGGGDLYSVREFNKDYHLKLQFKWGSTKWPPRNRPETARDSGLLYHVHNAPGVDGRTWARSVELQIQEHDVGDLYAVGSAIAVRAKPRAGTQPTLYDYDPSGEWTFFPQIQGSSGRCIKQPDNENPTGEWNTVELIAFHDEAIHIVNGKVVMRLHGPMRIDAPVPTPVNSGQIILQSEGAEIFYRDIQLKQISAIPAEFAAK